MSWVSVSRPRSRPARYVFVLSVCAIFMYEVDNHMYKVSMRSNYVVDVSRIASYFGGGSFPAISMVFAVVLLKRNTPVSWTIPV